MSITANSYGPYDSGAGANITENFWRLMTRWFGGSAVVASYLNQLNPFGDSTGLQAKVDTGGALIRGAYGEWTSGVSILALAAVGGIPGGQSRIDRIIVRNDFVNNLMVLDVLTGTAAASPSPPALTQNSSMYEMLLAEIGNTASGSSAAINNATTTITAGMVMDARWKMNESGVLFQERGPIGAAQANFLFGPGGTIPQNYRILKLHWNIRGATAAGSVALDAQLNRDTGANYNQQIQGFTGTTTQAPSETLAATAGPIATVTAASAGTATDAGEGECTIENFSSATFRKIMRSDFSYAVTTGTGQRQRGVAMVNWESTAAVNELLLFAATGNLDIGSWALMEVDP